MRTRLTNIILLKMIKSNGRMICITLIVNIMLLLVWYMNNNILEKEIHQKNIEHGMTKCSQVSNKLDNIILIGENVVKFIDRDYQYLSNKNMLDVENAREELINGTYSFINEKVNTFSNLYLVDEGYIHSAKNEVYAKISPEGRPWFEEALKTKDVIITSLYRDSYTDEPIVTISKQLGKESVVGLDISGEQIHSILNEAINSDEIIGLGLIINSDGIIIARTDTQYTNISLDNIKNKNYDYIKVNLKQILNNNEGIITNNRSNDNVGMTFKKTASDWYVIYLIDMSIYDNETLLLKRQVTQYFIISIFMLNAVILVYYLKRLKANQLKEKAEQAERNLLYYKDDLEKIVEQRTKKIYCQGKKLEKMNLAIIDNLADVAEFRDLETGQHVKRIKKYVSVILQEAIKLYPEYEIYKDKTKKISEASALHDLGKIGISDTILLKPGKLSFEEFEEMKKHTMIGAALIEKILEHYDEELKFFSYQICRYHHERCDGKGYPEGLKEEDIPLCAQVVGVADAYDALIEERVYKKAFSHQKAIEMIINGDCGKFSEKIINCLKNVEQQMKMISNKY